MSNQHNNSPLRAARILLVIFICGLIISGITAFPLEFELNLLVSVIENLNIKSDLTDWIIEVHKALHHTNMNYPFMSYGTDWLAFGHIVISMFFIGPLRDPVRNLWVVDVGLIACLLVFPLAFIAGSIRGIPLYWRFIDCSFGLAGGILLWVVKGKIRRTIYHDIFAG